MNTDDSIVEDMNIPHITECFSQSSVTSIGDRTLEIVFVFFEVDHSRYSRMISILTTSLILFRRPQ